MKKTLHLLSQGQQALLLLVLLGFIWGSGYSLAKYAMINSVPPLAYACCSIYIGIYQPKSIDALPAACGMLITATLILIPILIKQHTFYLLMPPFTLPKQAILLEILLSSLGYILFFKLIHVAGPVFYSLTGGVVALTGLLWGFIIFQEIPNHTQCIAALGIILAIFLLSWCQSQQTRYPLECEA